MSTVAPKTSFVHRTKEEKKKKTPLALLLLFFSNRKGALILLVAGALTIFLMLAPFGFDLGRFADYLSTKPALTWLAKAMHAADHWLASHGLKSSEDEYKDMYVARESELSWKSASSAASNGQDGVNPESMVEGGKEVLSANAVKPGTAEEPRALHPDETKGKDPVVPVDGALAGAKGDADKFKLQLSNLGAAAFGSGGNFSGPVGGVNPKDSLLQRIPNPAPPNGQPTPIPPGMRNGRMSKFSSGGASSSLSGKSGLLGAGGHYSYRLALAMSQTKASTTMPGMEDSTIWDRAWATGEVSEDGLDPGTATTEPATPVNPAAGAGGSGFAGAFQNTTGACASAGGTLGTKMDGIQAQMQKDSDTLTSLGGPNNPPKCCSHSAVQQWDAAINDEQAQCTAGAQATTDAEKTCASITGTTPDCSSYSKTPPQIRDCSDLECLVMLVTELLSFIPIVGNLMNAMIALDTLILAGVVWLFTAGQAGGAVSDTLHAAGDAAQNIIAYGGAAAFGGDTQEQEGGNKVGEVGTDWGEDVTHPFNH
jgi:hypothetical protein